jgi:3-hydroxyisobutyrate dehydrogenase-like beta-hydroxyacid dehydrogenase
MPAPAVVKGQCVRIGFIGLGSMGQPMARRLRRARHYLLVYNRTRLRAEPLARDGAFIVETPRQACHADVLITMLSDDAAVEEVLWPGGQFLCEGLSGLIHVGMSTVSDRLAMKLTAAHQAAQQPYISAPVFGTPDVAQSGKLVLAVAGPPTALDQVRPILGELGRIEVVAEDPATANIVKLAGNVLVGAAVSALWDTMRLVYAAGADPRQFAGIVTQALFPTPVYQVAGGALAKRVLDGADSFKNPFARSAQLADEAATRLATRVPTAANVASRG